VFRHVPVLAAAAGCWHPLQLLLQLAFQHVDNQCTWIHLCALLLLQIWITPIPVQVDGEFFGETGYHGEDWQPAVHQQPAVVLAGWCDSKCHNKLQTASAGWYGTISTRRVALMLAWRLLTAAGVHLLLQGTGPRICPALMWTLTMAASRTSRT
jgi:hypothetical protein